MSSYSRLARWGLFFSLLFPASVALSDWVAKDASGSNVIFDAVPNGGKQIPKNINTDAVGAQVGISSNPFFVGITQGGNTAAVSGAGNLKTDAVQSGTWSMGLSSALPSGTNTIGGVTQASGPWSSNITQYGGSSLSSSNPLPAQLSLGNTAVTAGNPVPTSCISGCSTSESSLATYSVGASFTVASSPSDIALIQGSATKIVKIRRIFINASNATAANFEVVLARRSSANSGGIATVQGGGRFDSNDPAPTAVVSTYTGVPTQGTTVSTLFQTVFPAGTGATLSQPQEIRFGSLNGDKPITLRGASEYIGITTGSPAGGSNARISVEWTEE